MFTLKGICINMLLTEHRCSMWTCALRSDILPPKGWLVLSHLFMGDMCNLTSLMYFKEGHGGFNRVRKSLFMLYQLNMLMFH